MRTRASTAIVLTLLVTACGSRETARPRGEAGRGVPDQSGVQPDTSGPRGELIPADTAGTWVPQGPDWAAYRTVFVRVVSDSAGNVKGAEVLHSYASPGETDSILALAERTRFDPKTPEGRIGPWQLEEGDPTRDKHYLVPYVTRGSAAPAPAPHPVTRAELERAGLGPWLAIWDELLPGWPLEAWSGRWSNRLYEYPIDQEIDDSDLMPREMVSVSTDGEWRLHPFYGVEFRPDGRAGFDADSGYILYRTRKPQRGRQFVGGTTTAYSSAEWIDAKRFVLAGTAETGVAYGGVIVSYRAPMLCFGHVDSLTVIGISGPPVSIRDMPALRSRLDAYTRQRYPKFWEATRH